MGFVAERLYLSSSRGSNGGFEDGSSGTERWCEHKESEFGRRLLVCRDGQKTSLTGQH